MFRAGPTRPGVAEVLDLAADDLLLRAVLVPDEHPAFLGADREHAEQHALQDQVRLGGQDFPVLERARLGLIGVADHVLRDGLLRRDQVPFAAGREASAAHAAQARILERGDETRGIQSPREHVSQHRVSVAGREIGIVGPPPGGVAGRPGRFADLLGKLLRDRLKGQRPLVDSARRSHVAAAEAGSLDDLDIGSRTVPLPDRVDPRVGAAQPAGQVMTDADLGLFRRLGPKVRVKRDEPLDLVQRPADVA